MPPHMPKNWKAAAHYTDCLPQWRRRAAKLPVLRPHAFRVNKKFLVTRRAWGMTPSNLAALAAWLYSRWHDTGGLGKGVVQTMSMAPSSLEDGYDTASLEIEAHIQIQIIKAKNTATGMRRTGCSLVALDVNIEVRIASR